MRRRTRPSGSIGSISPMTAPPSPNDGNINVRYSKVTVKSPFIEDDLERDGYDQSFLMDSDEAKRFVIDKSNQGHKEFVVVTVPDGLGSSELSKIRVISRAYRNSAKRPDLYHSLKRVYYK